MMLSDWEIRTELDLDRLVIDPEDRDRIQPASIDLRLGRQFRVFNTKAWTVGHAGMINPRNLPENLTTLVTVPEGQAFELVPGDFVLGTTAETVTLPEDLAARLEGKSSLGRLGLVVHSTAGFVDPGFSGQLTLELSTVSRVPLFLWPGDPIGQLCLFRLGGPVDRPYGSVGLGSRYQGQRGPTPSRASG